LIRAFAELLKNHQHPCRLVVTGPRDTRYTEPETLATQLGIADRIVFTGYVDDRVLSQLYHRAALFVFPSLYEGFGLPVLEAMAAGIPVVCSNRASLPEVCGDAALLADPEDPRAMATAMARVLSSSHLAGQLKAAGRTRAGEYTPRRMAECLMELYLSSGD
jgi:glycosyltransferase involved in cell wall biosynthesis